jgi:hypothetical protein
MRSVEDAEKDRSWIREYPEGFGLLTDRSQRHHVLSDLEAFDGRRQREASNASPAPRVRKSALMLGGRLADMRL